jgi:uncharacterized protein (DUF1684 family)
LEAGAATAERVCIVNTRSTAVNRNAVSTSFPIPNCQEWFNEQTTESANYNRVDGALSLIGFAVSSGLRVSLVATAVAITASCSAGTSQDAAMDVEVATKETEAWRAKHEADYRRDWVTIAGLHFLDPGAHTAGSAPSNDIVLPASAPRVLGRFVLETEVVRFEPRAESPVTLNGQPLTSPIELADDGEPKADQLAVGNVRMVVHRSGERKSLRVWDPEGELARGFLGFTWFPIQMDYRVTGRFIPDATPRDVQVMNTFGDLDTFQTQGVVEFVLHGQTVRLRPFTTRPNRFYFVFRDASSGEETYEAARFLYSDLREDGTTVLDFNQAYNPPCAFNPYTTCPIPLPENRLRMKILAGERAYPARPALPKS